MLIRENVMSKSYNMTLLELIQTCSFEELLPHIPRGHEAGFRRMYDELLTIKPDHHPDYSIIHLTDNRESCEGIDNRQRADDDATPFTWDGFRAQPWYWHWLDHTGQRLAHPYRIYLELEWERYLTMEVQPDKELNMPPAEALATCMWYMSYYGYTKEDVAGTADKISRVLHYAKAHPEELVSMSTLLEELRDRGIDV